MFLCCSKLLRYAFLFALLKLCFRSQSVRYVQTITSSHKVVQLLYECNTSSSAVVDCGTLDDPANGIVSHNTTTYNSVAMYSCNIGHNLTGNDMRTCLETGSWSGSVATCIGEYSQ